MKNSWSIITSLSLLFFFFTMIATAQTEQTKLQIQENGIEVFDFHTTNRCITCKAIETNTKYTLETYFSNELKNGVISFRVVNIDKKENFELAKKFLASGTSLFLNVIKNGKEEQIDLTQFAFMYGKKQDDFSKRLKEKIEEHLENS